jgi:hypothetical protein
MALCCLRIFSFLFQWSKDMPITVGDTEITISGVGSNPVKVRQTRYGYSGSYNVLQLGEQSSGQSVSLFVDPLSNTGAAFSGNGTELIVPQNFAMIAPTASNTTFKDVIRFNDGRVTMPNQPAFYVSHSVGGGGTFSANAVAVFNSVIINVGSNYSTSTGRFTAPVAGNYFFMTTGLSNNSSQIFFSIRKNGSSILGSFVESYSASAFQTVGTSVITNLSAGDYVDVFIGSNSVYGGTYANFNGHLIS